eukprot:1361354-Rhodomonas_salina.2
MARSQVVFFIGNAPPNAIALCIGTAGAMAVYHVLVWRVGLVGGATGVYGRPASHGRYGRLHAYVSDPHSVAFSALPVDFRPLAPLHRSAGRSVDPRPRASPHPVHRGDRMFALRRRKRKKKAGQTA